MFSVHSQLHWSFISKHKIFRAISARAVSASSQTSKFGSVKVGLDFRLYQINVLISHKIIKATTRSQSALIHQLYTAISCLIGCTAFLTGSQSFKLKLIFTLSYTILICMRIK